LVDGYNVKPPKAKLKVQRKKEHPALFHVQNNLSNLTAKILFVFFLFFLMKKIDGLSTIVWVSIPVSPILLSRVCRLGKNHRHI